MPAVVRIAVVGAGTDRLVSALRALPLAPDVAPFHSLFADSEALTRFQPEVLLMTPPDDPTAVVGALRLLRHLLPGLSILLVCEPSEEVVMAPLAQQLGVQLLADWHRPGRLVAGIEQARSGGQRPSLTTFVDLAHGIADAINNPLQLVAGHLQLVRSMLPDPQDNGPVTAALAGVRRIQNTIDTLRAIAEAADGPTERQPVDLAQVLHGGTEAATGVVAQEPKLPNPGNRVDGDRRQLQAAAAALLRFAAGLNDAGFQATVRLLDGPRSAGFELIMTGDGLDGWLLPRTFEPYYPNRMLRGGSHGLDLFLAQAVTLGHGGQAQAQRQDHATVRCSFLLPRAGVDRA